MDSELTGSAAVNLQESSRPRTVSPWNHSLGKRVLDILVSSLFILICLPLAAVAAILVAVTSAGPILFRQTRMGENGQPFQLLKFRTMSNNASQAGPGVTRKGDPRITSVGRLLRKCKLDELPQLLNVLRGDMSLVGPRPEVPEFSQALAPEHRSLLTLRPGLTGWATIRFRNEEELLAAVPPEDLVSYYRDTVMRQKAELDLAYAERATFGGDLGILGRTALTLSR